VRNAFVQTLVDLAAEDKNIFLMTADLGYNAVTGFMEAYPDRFINTGICEQNMSSMAAGMALEGKTVFTYSIANFPTLRCIEQIRNDIAYHHANAKIVSVGAGFSYGALGMSHHATEDIAIMRAIPEISVLSPCDKFEAAALTEYAARLNGPCYIRLDKGGSPELHDKPPLLEEGKPLMLRSGDNIAIFATGAITAEAVGAADKLKETNHLSCAVYSFPFIKPLDKDFIYSAAQKYSYIFTLEEHSILGGLGGAVAEIIAECRSNTVLKRFGLIDRFADTVGSQNYLRRYYEIDQVGIIQQIIKLI